MKIFTEEEINEQQEYIKNKLNKCPILNNTLGGKFILLNAMYQDLVIDRSVFVTPPDKNLLRENMIYELLKKEPETYIVRLLVE